MPGPAAAGLALATSFPVLYRGARLLVQQSVPDIGGGRVIEACANPACGKVLRYLREGRVVVFDLKETGKHGDSSGRRLLHYWLCGRCSCLYTLMLQGEDVCLVTRSTTVLRNVDMRSEPDRDES